MGNISNNLQASLGSMVQSAALRDASSLVTQLPQAGVISKDIDVGPVRRLVRLMLKEALTPPFSPNIIEKLSGDLYELVYETPFQLPVDLIFVMRALSTFEGVGRMLDPGFNLVSITKPYLIDLMTSNNQNNFALLPLIFATPISIDWIKCQLSMRKGQRIEKLKK